MESNVRKSCSFSLCLQHLATSPPNIWKIGEYNLQRASAPNFLCIRGISAAVDVIVSMFLFLLLASSIASTNRHGKIDGKTPAMPRAPETLLGQPTCWSVST